MTYNPANDIVTDYVQFVAERHEKALEMDDICPRCGAAMVALRLPSNVRGCTACQDMYYLNTERKIAFMQIGE